MEGAPPPRPRVYGVGLPKTGTSTLLAALETLGWAPRRCYGAFARALPPAPLLAARLEGLPLPAREEAVRNMAREALAADGALRDTLLGADAAADWPVHLLHAELAEAHPDALFVLTERESAEAAYESHVRFAARPDAAARRANADAQEAKFDVLNAHWAPALFAAHGQRVRRAFEGMPHRLLVVCWERGDGWDELCAFLGVPAPAQSTPFPHVVPA